MFTTFARRLTSWYVVAGVALVVLVMGALAVVALYFYVQLVDDGVDANAREAVGFSERALLRHQTFVDSARELEARLLRSGIRIVAYQFPPPPRGSAPHQHHEPTATIVMGGQVFHGDVREHRLQGSRLGLAIQTAFGGRRQTVDFVGGWMDILPDPDATQRVALWLLGGLVIVGGLAGALAWATGRFITSQALQPLVEVTHALQRFAARDFRPQSIAVAGKSEFDAIALAYNAAAAQVAAAFAERALAEQQMRQFVADAGHELRTPLTIVLGYIDLLRRRADEGDERSRRIFTSIALEGARMRTLIDNLVLLARMEGDDRREVEPFELRPLLEQIVEGRRLIAPGRRLDLDLGVDATVIGNRDEIHEAIANVVDNALKYAPGSPIEVRARAVEGGVEIRVRDYGPGIHGEDRDAIFDRFYRGRERGEVEGSGLGLAIAKRAVERAGGTLTLADTSPAGTTFAIRLRADQATPRERVHL
ncbi:MAG TPA: HAMP domain-containing sensor histidine kinase [Candidatus Sulfotelmatobacter sp.]|nr:HAMP domain-containing sensor histidine kinase [Candidatus Sulfotelmatobacter sp.]